MPVGQAQELLKALKANNATVWYAEFTDANHDNFPGTSGEPTGCSRPGSSFFKTFVLN